MADPSQYKTAAVLNNGPPPVGAPEGMAPSAVNDVLREIMASIAVLTAGVKDGSLVAVNGSIPSSRVGSSVPVGTIIASVNHVPPAGGWLPCGGQGYLRSQYPELAGTLGTSYNNADTPAHMFNVPDLRSTVMMGHDWMHNPMRSLRVQVFNTDTMGGRGGDQYPQTHAHDGVVWGAGNHSHSGVTDIVGDHVHTINIQPNGAHLHHLGMGGGYNANNVVSSNAAGSNNTAAAPGESSTIVRPSGLHVHSANMEATGRHGHNIGTYPVGDHQHPLTIHPTFGGTSQNIQPSLIVMFYIKT